VCRGLGKTCNRVLRTILRPCFVQHLLHEVEFFVALLSSTKFWVVTEFRIEDFCPSIVPAPFESLLEVVKILVLQVDLQSY
jgi:hypothetical protein